jgi:DNA-binding response OmpR family regulator
MTKLLTESKPETGRRAVIALSEAERKVYVDGSPCRLTAQEFRLLMALANDAGHVLSRDWLLYAAWDYLSPGKSRTVDVHVQRLRRKMGDFLFETVHGKGYKLCAIPLSLPAGM